MALYAIGDVQGCDAELGALLSALKFSADRDSLWFVGDLVNRGPDSLKVLRRIRALGDAATVILGNHDLHLLAVAYGGARLRDDDTLGAVLAAPDRTVLLDWLSSRPLLHEDPHLNVCMVHAGLAPQWDIALARECAPQLERALRRGPAKLFDPLYGDEPDRWDNALEGEERLRFIANKRSNSLAGSRLKALSSSCAHSLANAISHCGANPACTMQTFKCGSSCSSGRLLSQSRSTVRSGAASTAPKVSSSRKRAPPYATAKRCRS